MIIPVTQATRQGSGWHLRLACGHADWVPHHGKVPEGGPRFVRACVRCAYSKTRRTA